jgi:cobaltochelatase CobS
MAERTKVMVSNMVQAGRNEKQMEQEEPSQGPATATPVIPSEYQGTGGKVRCAVPGCKYEGHILVVHAKEEHGLDAENYTKLHPSAPLFSEKGRSEYEKRFASGGGKAKSPIRKKRMFSVRETFGVDLGVETDDNGSPVLENGKPKLKDRLVSGFVEATEFTPQIDPGYVFDPEVLLVLLMGFSSKDRILITGGTGTGKTSMLEQVAARLNYSVVKINFDACITRNDLVGEWIVKGKEMVFQYGVLPMAFRMPGCIIIFDEWDTISAETSFVIQRPLQKEDGKILIMETGGELVPLHEDNVLAATANTAGQGDESGLYSHGTRMQNYSQINRFGITIKMAYLEPDKEKEMLAKKYPDLEKAEVEAFVTAINKVRDGFSNGQISVPLSPRDLLNWAQKYLMMGDPMKAAKFCFLNRMSTEDAQVTEGIIQRAFEDA